MRVFFMYCCVRVYNNGQRVTEWHDEDTLFEWLDYNKTFRPGTALFVEGKCEAEGYLGPARCRAIEAELRPVPPVVSGLSVP